MLTTWARTYDLVLKYFLCSSDWLMHLELGYFACSLISDLKIHSRWLCASLSIWWPKIVEKCCVCAFVWVKYNALVCIQDFEIFIRYELIGHFEYMCNLAKKCKVLQRVGYGGGGGALCTQSPPPPPICENLAFWQYLIQAGKTWAESKAK